MVLAFWVFGHDASAGMSLIGTPTATFFATGEPAFLSIEGTTNAVTVADDGTNLVTGRFTTHGVTREVPVSYQIDPTAAGSAVRATFPFDVTAHGIEIPSHLGVTILPAMRADVVLELASDGR